VPEKYFSFSVAPGNFLPPTQPHFLSNPPSFLFPPRPYKLKTIPKVFFSYDVRFFDLGPLELLLPTFPPTVSGLPQKPPPP